MERPEFLTQKLMEMRASGLSFLLLGCACVFSSRVAAQGVTNVVAFQEGEKIGIRYELLALEKTSFYAMLFASADGGQTYKRITRFLQGDVNKTVSRGQRQIIWEAWRDSSAMAGNLLFKVSLYPVTIASNEYKRPVFENEEVLILLENISRVGNSVLAHLKVLNKSGSPVSTFFGKFFASVGNKQESKTVYGDFNSLITIKPREEKDFFIEVADVAPGVSLLSEFRFNFGKHFVRWSNLEF